jgi:hypothetical protein
VPVLKLRTLPRNPAGLSAVSRWLSAATPPVGVHRRDCIPAGCQHELLSSLRIREKTNRTSRRMGVYARRAGTTSAGAVRPRKRRQSISKARRADTNVIGCSDRNGKIPGRLMYRPFGPVGFDSTVPRPHGPGRGCFGPSGPEGQNLRRLRSDRKIRNFKKRQRANEFRSTSY